MERTIYNPIFKDTVTFIRTSEETKGRVSEMEVTLGTGIDAGTPPHTHTAFSEIFTAVDGELGVMSNGKKVILKPGETFIVHPGDVHNFYNPGDKPVKFQLQFKPGHTGMENTLRIMYGLARNGETDKKGIPKNLFVTAVLGEMSNTVLTGVLGLIAPLFKLLAVRARKKGIEKELLSRYCS